MSAIYLDVTMLPVSDLLMPHWLTQEGGW